MVVQKETLVNHHVVLSFMKIVKKYIVIHNCFKGIKQIIMQSTVR